MIILCRVLLALKHVTSTLLAVVTVIATIHFPYDIDSPLTPEEIDNARKFYSNVYQKPATETPTTSEYETEYIRVAEAAAKAYRIEEQVTAFCKEF